MSTPPSDEHINEVMKRVDERLAKLSGSVPHEVEVAIRHSEANFWLNPYETFHGGLPCFLIYPKDDGSDWPKMLECPDDVMGGTKVVNLMLDLWHKQDANFVVYSVTTMSGCLLVLVMTNERILYKMVCPILQYNGEFSLGDWNIERHEAEE